MEEKFKKIAEQYCSVKAEEMDDSMRFREDLGFSSLDLMTFLGELEDEFDIEFNIEENTEKLETITTVGDAIAYVKELMEEA